MIWVVKRSVMFFLKMEKIQVLLLQEFLSQKTFSSSSKVEKMHAVRRRIIEQNFLPLFLGSIFSRLLQVKLRAEM